MVLIENPVAGGVRFTSRKSAERYVCKGRARMSSCGKKLRFIEDGHQHLSAEQQNKLANLGYDGLRRCLKLQEIRHIPCTQASNAYTLATKPHASPAGRSGPVDVLIKDGQCAWQEENVA